MERKGQCAAQNNHELQSDIRPLIDLFEVLLEWDMKDVQEKEEKRKEISKKI